MENFNMTGLHFVLDIKNDQRIRIYLAIIVCDKYAILFMCILHTLRYIYYAGPTLFYIFWKMPNLVCLLNNYLVHILSMFTIYI